MKYLWFALLLISVSSAAGCVENFFQDIVRSDMGVNIAVAFMFAILVVVMAYILGTTFHEANFLVFYKDELFHLLFSAVLLTGIAGIMFFSCNVLSGFLDFIIQQRDAGNTLFSISRTEGTKLSMCYTGGESPQQLAQCLFRKMENDVTDLVRNSIKQSIKHEMDSTMVISIYTPITGGVSLPMAPGRAGAHFRTYATQYDMIAMNFAMPALISITMQRILIGFSVDFARFLLPAAFFLRVLPPTRSMGNMFIALSLALYIIIPVFYALAGLMDDVVFNNCGRYSDLITDSLVFGGCDSDVNFWLVARAIPQAFFLPNLMLAFTITFLSGINKALRVIT